MTKKNKKKPLTLKGLRTIDNRNCFILEKEDIFRDYFNEILEKAGIKSMIYEEQGEISQRTNEIDHFQNEDFDIDVIYTSNRIIIIVRGETKKLREFKSLILAYSKISS